MNKYMRQNFKAGGFRVEFVRVLWVSALMNPKPSVPEGSHRRQRRYTAGALQEFDLSPKDPGPKSVEGFPCSGPREGQPPRAVSCNA